MFKPIFPRAMFARVFGVPAPHVVLTLAVAAALVTLTLVPQPAVALGAMGPPSTDATPLDYRIDLTIDPAQTSFTGHVEIDAIVKGVQVFVQGEQPIID